MLKNIVSACMVALLFLSHAGCAPKIVPNPIWTSPMVWPGQPAEPRIAQIATYFGSIDFYEPTLFQILFGTSPRDFLHKPSAVYAAGDRIYAALTGDAAIAVIDLKARTYSRIADWGRGRIGLPLGIAGLPDGTIYVSDANAKVIFVFDKDGNYKTTIGASAGLKNPAGIAFNADHSRLYVVDSKAHNVKVLARDGHLLFTFGSEGKEPGQFFFPSTVAVSPKTGNVCIVDTQNFRVQIFDKDGKFIRTFGELGDQTGMFSRPKGIAIDSEGHLYVSDYAFSNIQIFTEEGQLLLWFGAYGSVRGFFQLPFGLFFDDRDRLYVADSLNNRVQVFQYMSEAWKRDHPDEYKVYSGPGTITPN